MDWELILTSPSSYGLALSVKGEAALGDLGENRSDPSFPERPR
jgi:hypothetical protein